MNVGLFFGSFNPIHIGHLIIAQSVLNQFEIDEIRLVVSPHNPLKDKEDLIEEEIRLQLAINSTETNSKINVEDIEFRLPRPSYTINTLRALENQYPNDNFYLIMGSDTLINIDRWKEFEEILKYPILVYKRNNDCLDKFSDINLQVISGPTLNISATSIRQLLKQKKSIKYLVAPEIESYLISLF